MAEYKSKLKKVVLEFEDCTKTLEGDEAAQYDEFQVRCQVFCHYHTGGPRLQKSFDWKTEPKT